MPYETGTLANAKALWDRIVAQVQATAFMTADHEWDLVYSWDGWGASEAALNHVINVFRLPGPSGTGDWHLAIKLSLTGVNTANFQFYAFQTQTEPHPGGASWSWAGTWSNASVSYTLGQVVKYSSSYYVCLADHTSTTTVPTSLLGTTWMLIASTSWLGAVYNAVGSAYGYYMKTWNGGSGDLPYWLCANDNRLILVVRSDSRWMIGGGGALERFGSPAQYPWPMIAWGNDDSETAIYTDSTLRNWPNFADYQTYVGLRPPSGLSIFYGAGSPQRVFTWPPGDYTTGPALGRNPAGDFPLHPVYVFYGDSSTGEEGLAGTLDGIFATDSRGAASGDIITAAGQDYLMVEDINRGESAHFVAVKLA